jgi:hypothetical protein
LVKEAGIKVTDKRIFTPEGDLREEYRYLEERPAGAEPASATPAAAPPPEAGRSGTGPTREPRREAEAAAAPGREAPPLEIPGPPPGLGAPTFFDLVAALAEPASVYLGDVPLPGGQSGEDLEMARLHIDLLSVLRQKTLGNLSAQEGAILDDLIYRLRMRYVQKRG